MEGSSGRYEDWKAPTDDGGLLIWPGPAALLRDAADNARRLAAADAVRVQHVPLPELRRRMRHWLGHGDDAAPLIATGHQAELYHPGVWVKDVLIHEVAGALGGQAYHFAVDTDEPKHLHLRWPGGSAPLTDEPPGGASWAGLLDAPSPAHIAELERAIARAAADWDFEPLVPRFLESMRRLAIEEPTLPTALTNSLHELDWSLGLRHHAMVFSPVCHSDPYLVLVHHVMARAGAFAADYNDALEAYRREHKVRTPGRPMPNLNVADDACEAPFWLDDLSGGGHRYRASVVRLGDRWAMRAPAAGAAGDDVFVFDPAAGGWDAAASLLAWLRRNNLRFSPRALTLTMLLRLMVADQFVHGIGGGRYDQVADALIARHFRLDPPRFAVTTATLYFPGAADRARVCMSCVLQDGHRLRHNVIGAEKRRLVEAIAAAPRRSAERSSLFFAMHGKLAGAARHPDILRWEQARRDAEAREQDERVVFDRELFYAIQPADRLAGMIETYRAAMTA
jgi:hypothetical protein